MTLSRVNSKSVCTSNVIFISKKRAQPRRGCLFAWLWIQQCTQMVYMCGSVSCLWKIVEFYFESARGAGYRLDAGFELGVGFQINGFLGFLCWIRNSTMLNSRMVNNCIFAFRVGRGAPRFINERHWETWEKCMKFFGPVNQIMPGLCFKGYENNLFPVLLSSAWCYQIKWCD